MGEFNETPYGVASFIKALEPEEPLITLVVTGNFALTPGGTCEPLPKEAQAKLQKAIHYADKIGNSRFTDSDVAIFKPRADCLFVGAAHAPNGSPVPFLEVTFGVGAMQKTLNVFGDRHWVRQADGSFAISSPQPFTSLPIRNELAHGGLQSHHNKHGIGFGDPETTQGGPLPVANIVPHDHQALHWTDDEIPAGFGTLPTDHGIRARMRGTFNGEWLYRRKPFPPTDFNPAFFNGARPDQQIDGFLTGDEEIFLKNLHPTHPEVRARLPGTRVRIFVHHLEDHEQPVLEEVQVVLDTCLVNGYDGTVRLSWRGTLSSGPSKKLSQIPNVMIVEEPVGAPEDQEAYFRKFTGYIKGARRKRTDFMEMSKEQKRQIDTVNAKAIADMVAALKEHGADERLIEEVERQETAEKAVAVLTRAAEALQAEAAGPTA